VPDSDLIGPAGTPPTVHGLLRGGKAAVLALSPEPSETTALLKLSSAIEERHGPLVSVHTVFTDPREASPASWPPIADVEGKLHEHLGVSSALCVLRPDGHIVTVSALDNHTMVLEALSKVFGGFGGSAVAVQRSFGEAVEVSTASNTVTSD